MFNILYLKKHLNYCEQRIINVCLFDNKLQNINNLNNAVLEKYYRKSQFFSWVDENQTFEQFVLKIESYMKEKENVKAYISFTKNKTKPDLVFKTNAYKRKYNITSETDLITQTKYYIINQIMQGDQWTLITDIEAQNRIKNGFKIEVFGSPFNARLPYFGSLFDTDEPFGRIGDAFEILDQLDQCKNIKWRSETVFSFKDTVKITINPPSSYELQKQVFERLYNIAQKRKIECYLDIQGGLYAKYNDLRKINNKYVVALRQLLESVTYNIKQYTDAYDLYNNITKPLSTPWYCIYFKNF